MPVNTALYLKKSGGEFGRLNVRKLGILTTLWTALLFFPLSSLALGLGEIEVETYLNQPLKAEIEVLSARAGEIDDLLVSLASREAFRKAGLQRPSNLSKLRFKVEKSEDGQSARILISTKTPVKEPFLNFLVEADWAKGRLLREFTILLDPPYFAQQPETPSTDTASDSSQDIVTEPSSQAAMSTRMDEATMPSEEQEVTQEERLRQPIALSDEAMADEPAESQDLSAYSADTSYQGGSVQDSEILVEKGDTLWAIASQFKDAEHSMGQVMLAMQAMNPEAFGQNNINNLKVGSILRAPDMDALDRLSKQQAYAQVLEQNGLWDEYVARKSGAATAGSPASKSTLAASQSSSQDTESQLSLLAPGDGESTSASLQSDANSEDAGQIRKQLALAEEELEASRLENDDLQSRITDLEQQLVKFNELQKLVQIEDSSLAQLQGNINEAQSEAATADEFKQEDGFKEDPEQEALTQTTPQDEAQVEQEQPTDAMIEAAGQMMSEEQADDQLMTDTMSDQADADTSPDQGLAESEPAISGETGLSTEAETVLETAQSGDEAEPVEGPLQEQEDEQAALVPPPVIITEVPTTSTDGGVLDMLPSLDSILGDPIMLGGIGAILALLLGLIFLKRKKSEDDEDASTGSLLDDVDGLLDDDATPIHVPTIDEAAKGDVDLEALDTEQHMADTLAINPDESSDAEDDPFGRTEIISAEDIPQPEEPVAEEQDDVLNEVDVYLAYGLYDNAEDLLKESLEEHPDRADYRAKLLDTYFATKNASGFTQEAEALKSLGGAAHRYWDRVQIMGYELAPENELFADARDSDLSVADLEYAKPDSPDFDIGAEDDITDFSSTDFDLGSDSDTFDVTSELLDDIDSEITDTETIGALRNTPEDLGLDEDIDLVDFNDDETLAREEEISKTDNLELPDQIGDFDLNLDGDKDDAQDNLDEDALSFDLPDDLDLSGDVDDSLISLEPTEKVDDMEEVPPMDEDGLEIDIGASDLEEVNLDGKPEEDRTDSGELSQTMVMVPGGDTVEELDTDADTDAESAPTSEETVEGTRHIDAALDMDMSDLDNADLDTGNFKSAGDSSSDEITEFRPADITGEFDAYDADSDEPVEDIDINAGLEKTGTYAPGDFNDELDGFVVEDESSESEDIEDLMLPDDVDEVGTKLDLAKAFIDMGDAEGAKSSLDEVLLEGTDEQKAEAAELMEKIK
jgi:pilus assembly protein FimV